MHLTWEYSQAGVNWDELAALYKAAPLGDKKPAELEMVFSNSMFKCFVFDADKLVGVGRALADGRDCSYLCDIAIHPAYQGRGIGKSIVTKLVTLSQGHRKIILYAAPGKETFYRKLGFKRMNTAMAIFADQADALKRGVISET